jgi:hypothetical protein
LLNALENVKVFMIVKSLANIRAMQKGDAFLLSITIAVAILNLND